jgi:DNA-binding transcriptional ArsR family regulator
MSARRIEISGTESAPPHDEATLAEVLGALADETRLCIVRQLADGGEIACGQFELSQPKSTLSHHFNVLISAGVIARRRVGTVQFNRLRREELDKVFPGLLDSILNV